MYKLLKEKGNNSNLVLENSTTHASIIIGKLTMEILSILELEGYVFNEDKEGSLKLKDEWSLEISDDAARKVANKTMKIDKPIKDLHKKVEQPKNNKTIDAMDVLLGLTNYS
ncbi:MAG: hypothetical protein K2P14_10425 [Anaeroplasmataceae bacterium]|nr:hypothetical protein [Anaeroplasmataceae bacterium]